MTYKVCSQQCLGQRVIPLLRRVQSLCDDLSMSLHLFELVTLILRLAGVLDWLGMLVTLGVDIFGNTTLKLLSVGSETMSLVSRASDCDQASLCSTAPNGELALLVVHFRNSSFPELFQRSGSGGYDWDAFCAKTVSRCE